MAVVKANVAKLFKADEAKVAQLFSGRPCLLKKDVDKATAAKYQQALKNAGAKPIINAKPVVGTPMAGTPVAGTPVAGTPVAGTPSAASTAPAAKPAATPAPAPKPATPAASSPSPSPAKATPAAQPSSTQDGNWDVLPSGSDLLREDEHQAVEAVEVATDHIALASIFDSPSTTTEPAPQAPDTSHISVAEAGADINPDAPPPAAEPELDLSGMSLAEVGSQLGEEKQEIPLPEPDLSEFSLAEVGERLTEESKTPPPPAPDTSHIQLK
jgi:hypothetical protein